MKSIKQWQKKVHTLAKKKGWYKGKNRSSLEYHALFHGEISEATEEVRNDRPEHYMKPTGNGLKPEGELIELADTVIRILDYCEFRNWDLEWAIELKHSYNMTRSERHGGKKY